MPVLNETDRVLFEFQACLPLLKIYNVSQKERTKSRGHHFPFLYEFIPQCTLNDCDCNTTVDNTYRMVEKFCLP